MSIFSFLIIKFEISEAQNVVEVHSTQRNP